MHSDLETAPTEAELRALVDRQMQRTFNYTGLPTNRVQDAAVTVPEVTQQPPGPRRHGGIRIVIHDHGPAVADPGLHRLPGSDQPSPVF